MRKLAFVFLMLAAGCAAPSNFLGNPLNVNPGSANRGDVEVFVKTNHPALIADLQNGGGPTLTQAYTIAGVPPSARDVQTLRLQSNLGLFNANATALSLAIAAGGT
ncbi:hypothetical protein N9V68_01775 [Octadecabacter sp.]|nr:hypothetical protein [Octadecabacter sp.]